MVEFSPVRPGCDHTAILCLLGSGEYRHVATYGGAIWHSSYKQIAFSLVITPGTAKQYVERIIGKLGVSDRTQAAVKAIRLGLVSAPAN